MIEPHLTLRVPLDNKWFIVHQYCIPLARVSIGTRQELLPHSLAYWLLEVQFNVNAINRIG